MLLLQFGYPGEDWAEIGETIQLLRDTRPDDIGVSLSYPLPGTTFFNRVQAQLGQNATGRTAMTSARYLLLPLLTIFIMRCAMLCMPKFRSGQIQYLRRIR